MRTFYGTQVVVRVGNPYFGGQSAPSGPVFPCPLNGQGWWSQYWPPPTEPPYGAGLAYHQDYRYTADMPPNAPLQLAMWQTYAGTNGMDDWTCWNFSTCVLSGMFSRANGDTNIFNCSFELQTQYSGEAEDNPRTETALWRYQFEVDDFADTPGDTNHVGRLALQETWSETNGFADLVLFASNSVAMPEDIDVFACHMTNGNLLAPGVYCVETETTGDDPLPLDITVFANVTNTFGPQLASTNEWCLYDDNGAIYERRQRVYFTVAAGTVGAYVRLMTGPEAYYTQSVQTGKTRLFRVRPVILVHGIDSKPWTQAEARYGTNAMGNWEDCLPWDSKAYPCVCYNFAWDPRLVKDNLNSLGNGKIRGIIEQDPGEANNPYIEKLQKSHGMDVVLIGHSMGGFIVRFALKEAINRDMIHKAVLLGSPMYGSDIALGPTGGLVPLYKNTSQHNLEMLRRGSVFVDTMRLWPGVEKCLCIAGKGAPPRLTKGMLIPYDRGLGHSDGVVPVSSALLVGAAGNIAMERDHGTVGLASYTHDDEYPFNKKPENTWKNTPDPCTDRRNKPAMFADELYKAVREYIK